MSDEFSERRPYNAVSDFVDANVARGLGKKIAFVDPDRSLSYGELQTRSIRFANALRALGIAQEQRQFRAAEDERLDCVGFDEIARDGQHPAARRIVEDPVGQLVHVLVMNAVLIVDL